MENIEELRRRLADGLVIPACPLALNPRRQWSERYQAGLARYYSASGAHGLAVGVHTTQFAIRDPKIALFKPVLELVRDVWRKSETQAKAEAQAQRAKLRPAPSPCPTCPKPVRSAQALKRGQTIVKLGKSGSSRSILVAGVCGRSRQALAEGALARDLGYDCALLSLGALPDATDRQLLEHCRVVADVIPLVGFYLQPAAGGRLLPFSFWRRFAEIPNVVAIKIAPFNRYQTLDVIRAVIEAGRDDIALYTGNDDHIVLDLLTPFRFPINRRSTVRHIIGGLLGHWAVWTKRAVELHALCRDAVGANDAVPLDLLRLANDVTDMNAALFDTANQFAGCIAGIHEVLRRQRLLPGIHCLNPRERLSPGQSEALDRVMRAYPHLTDDAFVAEHRDAWLR
jgi:hypothetical protein